MSARARAFWGRWLLLGGVYGVVVGLALVAGPFAPELLRLREAADVAFLLDSDAAGPLSGVARLAIAVSGALTVQVGVLAVLLHPIVRTDGAVERRIARAFATSVGVWFVLDSAASIGVGAPMNAVGNVTLLVAVCVPALMLARASGSAAPAA